MTPYDDLSNGLAQEAMREAADVFFGARVRLDREEELLRERAAALRSRAEKALDAAVLLHALLLDEGAIRAFYERLGMDAYAVDELLRLTRARSRACCLENVLGLTAKSRFAKRLLGAYERLHGELDAYVNGVYVTDEAGRKMLTPNYADVLGHCEALNDAIRKVNRDHAPSCVLSFCKRLDTDTVEKECVTGAVEGVEACSVDENLALTLVDCASLDLTPLPETPPPAEVKHHVLDFAKRLYEARAKAVEARLAELRREP